ncbi:MAG: helix-turn-helix transcriptional regulator [Clostridia bacterium]|nr:helix-turn-helix transcriptional regulator [Clostridia bacterium]
MIKKIREPKQERSIEKKKRIIEASYTLFSEVGYYGTNTAEIAKKAGVSTGIVYGYFRDKRDILISVLDIYIENAFEPILKTFETFKSYLEIDVYVPKIVEAVIKIHKKNAKMHEALHSLTHTDEAVNMQFITLEDKITIKLASKLKSIGFSEEGLIEKVHLAMDLVQSFAHEYVFDNHEYINYEMMKEMVTKLMIDLFK